MTPRSALWLLILLATLVRLVMAQAIGLGVDESYMVAAGRTLSWGYFDHPPIAWWLSWGAAHLFGSEAPVVVRLPFILLAAGSTWLVAKLAEALADARAGVWAALAFTCAPVLGFTSASWVLPDGPLDAALLAFAFCYSRALRRGDWGWWLGAGLFAGLALMSKYTAVLVLFGAFAYLLTDRVQRPWLGRLRPWVAALLALVVFSPVIFWNAGHGWASLAFQGGRAEAVRFQPFGPLVVLAGGALFVLPWIWAALMVVALRAVRRGPADRDAWLLCCLGLPPVVFFAVVAFWSRHVLFHWAAPGYLLLLPLLGAALSRRDTPRLRKAAAGTVALLLAGLAVVAAQVRWAPIPLPKDTALEAVDLTPLRAALAARGLLMHPVAAPSWSAAGKIGYALGADHPILCLNRDDRQFGFLPGLAAHRGEDILIVAPRTSLDQLRGRYAANFAAIEALPPAVIDLPGRPGHVIPLFLGHDLRRWP